MVTKKGLAIFMSVGLVPLLICFVVLFPFGFFANYLFGNDKGLSSAVLIPPCLTVVTYLVLLGCFYLEWILSMHNINKYKTMTTLAFFIVGLLFHLTVGASLFEALYFVVFYQIKPPLMVALTCGLGPLMLCGAIGLSLWPLVQSKEDSFNISVYKVIRSWMRSISLRRIAAVSIALVGVIVYLIFLSGAVSFTIGILKSTDGSGTFIHRYRSFFIVPVYVIVGSFPVFVVSKVLYNTWKPKTPGYFILPTSCLLSVAIGFGLYEHAFIQQFICRDEDIKQQPLCAGSATTLTGIVIMMLFILIVLLLWSHLFLYEIITEGDNVSETSDPRGMGLQVRVRNDTQQAQPEDDDVMLL